MSLAIKSLKRGVARIFTMPRLSVSLISALGLTLGAVLCVIAIVSALLFRPLPGIANSAQLYSVDFKLKLGSLEFSALTPHRINHLSKQFADLGQWAGIDSKASNVQIDDTNFAVTQFTASQNISKVLGTKLLIGQPIDESASELQIWISNSLWQSAYAGDDDVVGQIINQQGKRYVITGILQDVVGLKTDGEMIAQQLWFIDDYSKSTAPQASNVAAGGINNVLLKPYQSDVDLPNKKQIRQWFEEYVKQEITQPMMQQFTLSFKFTSEISPYRVHFLGDSYKLIIALAITVAGLLLMATLNLLNLFLSHYQSRSKEFAIALSIGASVWRLRLLVMLENLPLFSIAGVFGLLVSGWIIKALPIISNDSLPMISEISIDNTTMLVAMVLVLGLVFMFSLLALVDVDKQRLMDSLNSSGKGNISQTNHWLSRSLMVLQLSIASILMTGTVMLAKSSFDSVTQSTGFEINNQVRLRFEYKDKSWLEKLGVADGNYKGSELAQLNQRMSQSLEQEISGAKVIITDGAVLSGVFRIIAFSTKEKPDEQLVYQERTLSASYFEAFKINMLAGKNLTQQQIDNGDRLVVVDSTLARLLYPELSDEKIIGQEFHMDQDDKRVIAGIAAPVDVGDDRFNMPMLYNPEFHLSSAATFTIDVPSGTTLSLAQLKPVFDELFPRLELVDVETLQSLLDIKTAPQRVSLLLLVTVSLLTLLLAIIGVSSLTLMNTQQKKYEMAVRMATGATQANLLCFILKDAVWLLIIGLGLGFALSVFTYDWLKGQVTLLPDFNWLTLTTLDITLVLVVLLSVVIPAWRVIKQDPISALRQR
ncbi:MAG: FtsX-like permease family protein [Psychrobium sp.]|nr:FtsX-like permease family protein [Psychrobium sp.]